MSFQTDVQELKTGLIIFRREDVKHDNWYCRVKIPESTIRNRYKTISLKTSNEREAKDKAFDHDADIRFRVKHRVPVFEKSFGEVCDEYVGQLKNKAEAGQITWGRWKIVEGYIRLHLKPYAGHLQVVHVGDDQWNGYPAWRKKNNAPVEAKQSYGPRKLRANGKSVTVKPNKATPSDAAKAGTIRQEMATFMGVMNYAARKLYIRENQVPKGKLPEDNARREAFTLTEYRKLHTDARNKWIGKGETECNNWYRDMTYVYMLIMTNTGMRTIEARFLRWRNVEIRTDQVGRTIIVLSVRGKKKHRELVAAGNVAEYFERIKEFSLATNTDDFVFCNYEGKQCIDNYNAHIKSMLTTSGLLYGENETRRSAYSFRHTYATFRLMEGVDSLVLANQMGTSQKMIEKHYGHITPVKNAARVLQGMTGWEPIAEISVEKADSVNAGADGKKRKTTRAKRRASFGRTKGEHRPTAPESENQAHRPPRRT